MFSIIRKQEHIKNIKKTIFMKVGLQILNIKHGKCENIAYVREPALLDDLKIFLKKDS